MIEIKLLQLTINNFKGCRHLALDLQGRSASIYGSNGTGKTTIYDAFTWLLFGKNSQGASDFGVKPRGRDGQVEDHGAVSEVEAVFDADGEPVKLKRTFFERWSTKRGSSEATYDGNTSEYFVDEVPVKKYEFERRVGGLVSEDLFRTLTDVWWFCGGLDWKARRKTLLEVCEVPDDRIIMSEDGRFAGLSAAIGRLTMDDYKKKLQAQRKGLNGARNTIPARLDEQKKSVEALAAIDFGALEAKRNVSAAHLEQLQGELVKLGHGALLDAKRNELSAAKIAVEAEINSNTNHRKSQMIHVEDRRPAIQAAVDKAIGEGARWHRMAVSEGDTIRGMEESIQSYRDSWAAENARTFQASNCPTCGQMLPETAQRIARDRFEAEKKRAMQATVEQADRVKAALAAAQSRREEYLQAAGEAEDEADRRRTELAAYRLEEQSEIHDLPGHRERLADAEERVRALTVEVEKLEGETSAIRAEITAKVNTLRIEVEELDRELAKRGLLDYARQREEELRREAQKTAEELEALDKQLFLCEEFTRFKVSYIEGSINDKFRLARFKLFQEQVNGGLADCCEVTYNGVPYGDLNNGMKVNIGIDVIRTLSGHYGVCVPLVVDNAESIVELLDTGTQVIRLVVSGADKELRCEYGT